jgi:hypothetical protein
MSERVFVVLSSTTRPIRALLQDSTTCAEPLAHRVGVHP